MKKFLKVALPIAGVVLAAAGAAIYMTAPGKASEEKKAPFKGRNIAHRGLHKVDKSVPENSIPAFKEAVDKGYGVEFDVHITADDQLVVFHDDDLERMCSEEGKIEEKTYEELKPMRLAGTDEHIPLLSEVLQTINGEVPIVLELKRGARNKELCERTYAMLRLYRGDVCIESFDPFIVRWWRINAPEVLRGQLSTTPEKLRESSKWYQAFAVGNVLTNFLCRPHFIAYGLCEKKPWTVRLSEKLGAMRVAWTSRGWGNEENNDTVIFEYYRPRIRFK